MKETLEPRLPPVTLAFEDSKYSEVKLTPGANLSEVLNIQNSPILFGCRTGICGTCLIEVVAEASPGLHSRTVNEREFFEAMAPDRSNLRLACQVHIDVNARIKKVEL